MKSISGSWQDASGNPAAWGELHLKLNQDAVIPATSQNAPREVSFLLDKTGSLPVGSQIWANDEMLPTGTYYILTVIEQGGGLIWGPQNMVIQGAAPVNLNAIVPLPGIAGLLSATSAQTVVFTRPPLQAGVINARVSDISTSGSNAFVTVSDQFVLAGVSGASIIASKSLDSMTASIVVSLDTESFPAFSAAALGSTVTNQIVLVGGSNVSLSNSTDSRGMTVTFNDIDTAAVSLIPGANIGITSTTNVSGSTFTISGASGGGNALNVGLGGAVSNGIIDGYMGAAPPANLMFVAGSNIYLSAETVGSASSAPNAFNLSIQAMRLSVVGGSNITLSTLTDRQGTTATINAPAGATGGGGSVSLIAGSNISISSATNAAGSTFTISDIESAFSAGISGGNTAGQTAIVSNQLMLAGGPNITLSGSSNSAGLTVSISGTSGGSATMQSVALLTGAGSVQSDTGNSAVSLLQFIAGSNITLSGSSAPNAMNIMINAPAGGGGGGSVSFVQGPNITISSTTNNSGTTASFSAGTAGGGAFSAGASGGGAGSLLGTGWITPSGVGVSNVLRLVAGSNVTLSALTGSVATGVNAGQALTITINAGGGFSAGVSSNTIGSIGPANTQFTGTVSNQFIVYPGTNITMYPTTNAAGMSVSIAGVLAPPQIGITVPGGAFSTIGSTSGFTNYVVASNLRLVAGSNIGLSIASNTGSAAGATSSNATITINASVGSVSFVQGANVGITSGTDTVFGTTVTVSAGLPAGAFQAGVSSTAIGTNRISVSGDTGPVTNQIILAPFANLTFIGSSNTTGLTVSLSGPFTPQYSFGTAAGGTTVGNVFGPWTPTQYRVYAGSNITLSIASAAGSNLSVTINAGSVAAAVDNRYLANAWPIMPSYTTISDWQLFGPAPIFWPFHPHVNNSLMNSANMFFYFNQPGAGTAFGSLNISLGIYTRTGSTLSQMSSGSNTYRWSLSHGVNDTLYGNLKMLKIPIPGGMSFDARDYWMGFALATTTNSQSFGLSVLGVQMRSGDMAGEFGVATAASWQQVPGWGLYTGANVLPVSLGFSDLEGTAGTDQRAPLVYLAGFTA